MASRRQRTALRATHAAPGQPSSLDSASRREALFSDPQIWKTMDRAQVLGGPSSGHRGCVNALSWAEDGSTLLTGSDDKRLCIWTPDPAPPSTVTSPHPLKLSDTILTGHQANIFSAHFLSEISTPTAISCAGDSVIGVYEVERLGRVEGGRYDGELEGRSGPGTRQIRCHTSRVKKLLPSQLSPSVFLSVSEDGTIRQHDLRESHNCRAGECPDYLWRAPGGMELYTLSTQAEGSGSGGGWAMVAGGRSEYAYLLDRRMLRQQQQDWGDEIASTFQANAKVQCVRRFGLPRAAWDAAQGETGSSDGEADIMYDTERHVTSVRMSRHVSHEVLVNFSNHSTSLFSIYDTPASPGMRRSDQGGVLPPNIRSRSGSPSDGASSQKRARTGASRSPTISASPGRDRHSDMENRTDILSDLLSEFPGDDEARRVLRDAFAAPNGDSSEGSEVSMGDFENSDEADEEDDDDDAVMWDYQSFPRNRDRGESVASDAFNDVPVVHPRRSYFGARNHETVKDCAFVGARSDKVVSGSDDGNFFVWDKDTGKLEGIWEGDGSVVNVVEQHPTLPILAVSGIDCTIKIFAPLQPTPDPSFSRMDQSETIIARNTRPDELRRNRLRIESAAITQLLARHRQARGDGVEIEESPCTTQ